MNSITPLLGNGCGVFRNLEHETMYIRGRYTLLSAYGMANFTAEQLAAFRENFSRYDVDKNGSIAGAELHPLLESLGYSTSASQVKAFLKSVDTNHSGSIEFDEFVAMVAQKIKSDPALKFFQALDKNGDGYLSADELRTALQQFGQSVSEEDLARYIAKADKDGDGKVNYEEFAILMSRL